RDHAGRDPRGRIIRAETLVAGSCGQEAWWPGPGGQEMPAIKPRGRKRWQTIEGFPGGNQSARGRRFPRRPVAPFPGSDGSLRPGEHLLVTLGRGCGCGQTARWITLWIAWGGHGASLWTPAGKLCEFRGSSVGKALRNCGASIHPLWTTDL